jgi:hypothetical protein
MQDNKVLTDLADIKSRIDKISNWFTGIIFIVIAIALLIIYGMEYATIIKILFFWGIVYLVSRVKTKFELNKEKYGVEEPDATWECPQCNQVNKNTTYKCVKCSYKIL